jgi:thioredoxin-related protein
MSRILLAAILILSSFQNFAQEATSKKSELVWYTDATKAQQLSSKTKKPIFGFFTGSDWCGWCHKLQNDVFSKPEFISWAKKNVILLELDFPRRKQLPAELAEQNAGLQQAFKVQGYPTIWLFYLNKDKEKHFSISALGSLGYPSGSEPGKEQLRFLEDANKILKNKS